jgi:hypothetical protein
MMRAVELRAVRPGTAAPLGWRAAASWLEFSEGEARVYLSEDNRSVRVEGPGAADLEVALPLWLGVGFGARHAPGEQEVRDGVVGEAGGHRLVVAMPTRGLRRRDRRLLISVDERSYRYEACGFWMSGRTHMIREPRGDEVYLTTSVPDRSLVADDVDAIERALVAMLVATGAKARVVVNPVDYV